MLMITTQKSDQGTVLKMKGRVAGPWSEELARYWSQAAARFVHEKLSIDLRDLTFADHRGTDVLRAIYAQTQADLIANTPWTRHLAEEIKSSRKVAGQGECSDYQGMFESLFDLPGKFFNKLSPETFNTLMWMASPLSCSPGEVLFREDDLQMESVYLLLDGKVKLSIRTADGRSVIYAVAKKGDILGLASAVSGSPAEMTAETIEHAKIARIWRQDFSYFLLSHADAYEAVIKEVREDLMSAMEFFRTVGSDESRSIEGALRKLRRAPVEVAVSAG